MDSDLKKRITVDMLEKIVVDVEEIETDMKDIFEKWEAFPFTVKRVFCNIHYDMGRGGFRKMNDMIAAANNKDWIKVIDKIRESAWYDQNPERAKGFIHMLWYMDGR